MIDDFANLPKPPNDHGSLESWVYAVLNYLDIQAKGGKSFNELYTPGGYYLFLKEAYVRRTKELDDNNT
jgi:hypothetical protein